MSNYTQTTFFGPKDNLALGDPNKLILGTQVDTELANLATAIASKYDSSSIAASPIGLQAGTAALPALYFGSSSTTGLYQPLANQLGISVNGANALTVSSTGLTVAGNLAASTAGSSLQGGVSVLAAASGNSLAVQCTTTAGLSLNATTAAGDAFLTVGRNGTLDGIIGSVGTANDIVTGSVAGDLGIRTQGGNLLFSINSGGAIHARLTSAGLFQVVDDGGTLQTVGWRGTPVNLQTGNYTLQLSDRGKTVYLDGNSANTLTVPSGVFSAGDAVTLICNQTGGSTVTGSGVSIAWANGAVTTGNRTMTPYAIATLVFVSGTNAFISGAGLS